MRDGTPHIPSCLSLENFTLNSGLARPTSAQHMKAAADDQAFPHCIPLQPPALHLAFTGHAHSVPSPASWLRRHPLCLGSLWAEANWNVSLYWSHKLSSCIWIISALSMGNILSLLLLLNFNWYLLTTLKTFPFPWLDTMQALQCYKGQCLLFEVKSTCSANNVHHLIDDRTVWTAMIMFVLQHQSHYSTMATKCQGVNKSLL